MSELEETLRRISHDFAKDVIQALMKLPFEAWYEEVDLETPAPAVARDARAPGEVIEDADAQMEGEEGEMETSILEHLNEAGPTGSTVRAWVISTHGELEPDEHDRFEREASAVLESLESKGLIQKRAFSRSRGQVFALAPV
ncbi:MAG: hypothetical protein U0270_14700 [Labilithrix sp.]